METTNDRNPLGTQWYQTAIYGDEPIIYPEEEYQIAALPKTLLHKELSRRLGLDDEKLIWKGKEIDCSAISDNQLLHYIALHLLREDETMTYTKKIYSQNPLTGEVKLISEDHAELRIPTNANPHTPKEIEQAFAAVKQNENTQKQ